MLCWPLAALGLRMRATHASCTSVPRAPCAHRRSPPSANLPSQSTTQASGANLLQEQLAVARLAHDMSRWRARVVSLLQAPCPRALHGPRMVGSTLLLFFNSSRQTALCSLVWTAGHPLAVTPCHMSQPTAAPMAWPSTQGRPQRTAAAATPLLLMRMHSRTGQLRRPRPRLWSPMHGQRHPRPRPNVTVPGRGRSLVQPRASCCPPTPTRRSTCSTA